MPTIDVDGAVSFILGTDDSILASLAQYAKGDCRREEALDKLKVNQREDGGWAKNDKDFLGELSNITATIVALQWLNWIEDRHSLVLQRTLEFLRGSQRADGSWDEPQAMADLDPPFWMLPGRYENQLWLTSAICCKLKELGQEQHVDFPRALEFIRRGWDGEKFPEYPHTHWMAMPLFHLQGADSEIDKQIIKGCKEFLYKDVKAAAADSGDLVEVAYASHLAGDAAADLLALTLGKIKGKQQEDGGWHTNHGEQNRAYFTVNVLFLFKKMGLI